MLRLRNYNFMNSKTSLLSVLLMVASPVNAQEKKMSIDPPDKQFTIENCVNEFSMEKASKTNSGYRYWFADKDFIDGRTLKLSVIAPNQASHEPHKHEVDEFFFVIEGKAKFHLNGKTKIVGPYTSLYCPSNSTHGISNAGDVKLKYLVIKKYPQEN